MIDTQTGLIRKNRINLSDCDVVKDIQTRLILNSLNPIDISILEEILYSCVKFPIEDLKQALDLDLTLIQSSLTKLHKTDLFTVDGNTIIVNKEKRKYLETEFERFKEDFTPNLEFLRAILKRIPIHILPTWYQVPKATNNIFDSLVEKYFINPHTFDRYLLELVFPDPLLHSIVNDVFDSENLELPASFIIEKYALSEETFAEIMLFLEYSFVLFSTFKKEGEKYIQILSPLHEWREYLLFVKNADPKTIGPDCKIDKFSEDEYAFSTDMATILNVCMQSPLKLEKGPEMFARLSSVVDDFDLQDSNEKLLAEIYLSKLTDKLVAFHLAKIENGFLKETHIAKEWTMMPTEKRAFSAYMHPSNQMMARNFSQQINTSRNVREIEKTVCRILDKEWVYFDDFMKGVLVSFSEINRFQIKKEGLHWKFSIPEYTQEERAFIEMTILEWLFESGIIQTGMCSNRICLRATSLGRSLFKV
jgi:hypothetical protein